MRLRIALGIGAVAALLAGCSTYDPDSVLGETRVKIRLEQNDLLDRWESGDRVQAFAMNGTKPVSSYVFTASDDGMTADFYCPTDVVETSHYRFVHPSGGNLSMADDGIRATIPVRQNVFSGTVDPELLLCAGVSSSLDQEVSLRPLPAFVRFTLLGGAAKQVKHVTLTGTSTLAGSMVFLDADSFRSHFYNKPFDGQNPSNYIQLSGEFDSGGSYTAAVLPGATSDGMLLVVEDNSGATRSFEVDATGFTSGTVTDLGTFYLGHTLVDEGDLIPIMTATKGPKPIVLLFVPDGWVEGTGEGSREEFIAACREGAAYLFNVEPFKSMRDHFTVYIAWKAAAEAGVGTTFGTQLGLWYENYLGLPSQARKEVCDFAESVCPEIQEGRTLPKDMGIFLLVNGRKHYGAVCEWSEPLSRNEGRFIAVVDYSGTYTYSEDLGEGVVPGQWGGNTSTGAYEARLDDAGNTYTYTMTEQDYRDLGYVNYTGDRWGTLGTWKNTLLHEGFGHGIGRLQDEYWLSTTAYTGKVINGHDMTPPRGLNVSASNTDYPWKKLMDLREELMARDPRYGRIGMYQGGLASYFSGVWRPERAGAMNDLRPYFGAWDRALIYQRILQMSGADPDFDVRNEQDLRTFLEADLAMDGNFDPLRDNP